MSERETVQRVMAASPEAIFAVLADPSRHAEIDGSGTVRGPSSAGSRRLGLGDSFGMQMHWGVPYATRNVVTEFVPDRLIAWQTLAPSPLNKLVTGRVWRYELEPTPEGTRVSETWDISSEAAMSKPFVRRLAGKTRANMEATLKRLEQVTAERAAG